MTWGEACNFILNYSDYYSDNLKKLRIVPISKASSLTLKNQILILSQLVLVKPFG